jgi:hypothetical protein
MKSSPLRDAKRYLPVTAEDVLVDFSVIERIPWLKNSTKISIDG